MWHIHKIEYYSAIKRIKYWHTLQNESILQILGSIKEVRHKRPHHCVIPLTGNVQNRQFLKDRKKMSDC